MNEIPVVNWTVSCQGRIQKQLGFLICAGRAVCLKILKLCSLPSKTGWSLRFSCLKAMSEERNLNSELIVPYYLSKFFFFRIKIFQLNHTHCAKQQSKTELKNLLRVHQVTSYVCSCFFCLSFSVLH